VREVGSVGSHRIRQVSSFDGDAVFAEFVVGQKQSWHLLSAARLGVGINGYEILRRQSSHGRNLRLDLGAERSRSTRCRRGDSRCFHTFGPNYNRYREAVDWDFLHVAPGVWDGAWPGLVYVGMYADIRFDVISSRTAASPSTKHTRTAAVPFLKNPAPRSPDTRPRGNALPGLSPHRRRP